jgi:hypothetical protein
VPHTPLTRQHISAERRSLDFTSTSHYLFAVKVFVVNGGRDAEDGVPAGVYTKNVAAWQQETVLRFRLLAGA